MREAVGELGDGGAVTDILVRRLERLAEHGASNVGSAVVKIRLATCLRVCIIWPEMVEVSVPPGDRFSLSRYELALLKVQYPDVYQRLKDALR